ncbi:MAG: DKNYY domain-containing protein [Acidobacteriota bacterium]|nr:DKNYY domain-containing protein [Acidobacteriota bacterium]
MTPVENDTSHLYYKNRVGVYIYHPRDCGFIGCIGPDLKFLEFFRYERIGGAKPDSFHIVYSGSNTGDILAADKTNVFYGGKRIADGDVKTLEVVTRGAVTYGKDSSNLYLRGTVTKNKEEWEGVFLNGYFLINSRGLFAYNNTQKPSKLDLPDASTFQVFKEQKRIGQEYSAAEDKNFFYINNGGSYLVEPKPEVRNFMKLGCGYYKFENRIYYSLFLLPEANPETFRVLKSPDNKPAYDERCNQFYAIDKNHRWEFQIPVRPQDEYRNRQIDDLLKSPINQ